MKVFALSLLAVGVLLALLLLGLRLLAWLLIRHIEAHGKDGL